jgi:CubicO group peptidase (beta-lactamase class C family)
MLALVAVLTAGIWFAVPLSARAADASQAEQLHRYMALASSFGFSGSVLVARNGNIEINEGFGYSRRETGVRNTATSIFDIGSITKQFTATAIAKLESDGKLSSDDTLAKFFPSVPKDKAAITLHQLLTHTSGIAVYGPGSDYFVMPEPREVEYLFQQPLAFAPGTQSRYSNGDYSLLGYIVNHVSGQTLDKYLRSTFFDQLHMDATGYQPPANPAALTYQYADDVPFSNAQFLPSIDITATFRQWRHGVDDGRPL